MDEREERTRSELAGKIRTEREIISGLLSEIFHDPRITKISLTRLPEDWEESMKHLLESYPTLASSRLCRLMINKTSPRNSVQEEFAPHAVIVLSFHSKPGPLSNPAVSSSVVKMYLLGESSVIGAEIEKRPGYKASMRDEGKGDIGEAMRIFMIRETLSLAAAETKRPYDQ